MSKKILIVVGSLRQGSYNLKIAKHIVKSNPIQAEFKIAKIDDLALYSELYDDASETPEAYTRIREDVEQADGVIFITPEYNRGTSAALKNAIDVVSRPWGQSKWNNKPCSIISSTIGTSGAISANYQVRQTLNCLNAPVMPVPEVCLFGISSSFNENDELINEIVEKILENFTQSFDQWIEKFKRDF